MKKQKISENSKTAREQQECEWTIRKKHHLGGVFSIKYEMKLFHRSAYSRVAPNTTTQYGGGISGAAISAHLIDTYVPEEKIEFQKFRTFVACDIKIFSRGSVTTTCPE